MLSYLTFIAIITTCYAISANKQFSSPKKDKYQPGPKLIDETTRWSKCIPDYQNLRPRYRFHPTAWSHGQVVQKFIDQLAKEKRGSLQQVEGEIRKQ
uniref:Secreted protein n=1 Tax=Meloidogyne hapla TaxID=6305 RepID=A0A1I8BTA4_MELHA